MLLPGEPVGLGESLVLVAEEGRGTWWGPGAVTGGSWYVVGSRCCYRGVSVLFPSLPAPQQVNALEITPDRSMIAAAGEPRGLGGGGGALSPPQPR